MPAWSLRQARNKRWSANRLSKQELEARVAEMGIGELKYGNIKDQIEQSMFKNTRENKVEFVLCWWWGWQAAHQEEPHDMFAWTSMDSSSGEKHAVGVEGFPSRPRSRMSAGEASAGWDKFTLEWEPGSPRLVGHRVGPSGLIKRLQIGEAPGTSVRGVPAAGGRGAPGMAGQVVKFGQVVGEAPAGCCVLPPPFSYDRTLRVTSRGKRAVSKKRERPHTNTRAMRA